MSNMRFVQDKMTAIGQSRGLAMRESFGFSLQNGRVCDQARVVDPREYPRDLRAEVAEAAPLQCLTR